MEPLNTPLDRLLARKRGGRQETLMALQREGALYNLVATEVQGRKFRTPEGRWLVDFASCNYLGFDLEAEVQQAILPAVERYGTHPSWARLAAGPDLYNDLERELALLLGAEDTMVLPTISLIAVGLLPALVGKNGVLFVDRFVHKVNHDGCRIARDHGATLVPFTCADLAGLRASLEAHQDAPDKVVVLDGVLSVTGAAQEVRTVAEIAAQYDALVYVDDAHGFGLLGEHPSEEHPYGQKGNGIVRYQGGGYDNVLYVAGLSKAYSSLAAFFTCSKALREYLQVAVTGYVFSGPCPTASLATALAGLRLNERDGDARRKKIHQLTTQLVNGLREMDYRTDENQAFPIQGVQLGTPERVIEGGKFLFEQGFMATMQAWPVVPKDQGVLRFTITSANTEEEVAQLLHSLRLLRDRLRGM